MVFKKRERGEREPAGAVKAAIILYLSDNGERTFTEIRNHLRDRYNIVTGRIVRVHLLDLSDEQGQDLLIKAGNGIGRADSYLVRPGFFSLRQVYNFLKSQGLEAKFMKTRYFLEETGSRDFLIMAKVNFLRNAMAQYYDSIIDDARYTAMKRRLDRTSAKDREILVGWMDRVRAKDDNDALVRNFLLTVGCLAAGDVGDIGNIFQNRLLRREPDGSMVMKDEYMIFFSIVTVSDRYREKIVTLMRLSPGALDYLLNSTGNSAIFPPDPVQAYAINLLLRRGDDEIGSSAIVDIETCRRYMEGLPCYLAEPPIFHVAKSLFIADMVYGRTVVEDIPEEQLKQVFLEN